MTLQELLESGRINEEEYFELSQTTTPTPDVEPPQPEPEPQPKPEPKSGSWFEDYINNL